MGHHRRQVIIAVFIDGNPVRSHGQAAPRARCSAIRRIERVLFAARARRSARRLRIDLVRLRRLHPSRQRERVRGIARRPERHRVGISVESLRRPDDALHLQGIPGRLLAPVVAPARAVGDVGGRRVRVVPHPDARRVPDLGGVRAVSRARVPVVQTEHRVRRARHRRQPHPVFRLFGGRVVPLALVVQLRPVCQHEPHVESVRLHLREIDVRRRQPHQHREVRQVFVDQVPVHDELLARRPRRVPPIPRKLLRAQFRHRLHRRHRAPFRQRQHLLRAQCPAVQRHFVEFPLVLQGAPIFRIPAQPEIHALRHVARARRMRLRLHQLSVQIEAQRGAFPRPHQMMPLAVADRNPGRRPPGHATAEHLHIRDTTGRRHHHRESLPRTPTLLRHQHRPGRSGHGARPPHPDRNRKTVRPEVQRRRIAHVHVAPQLERQPVSVRRHAVRPRPGGPADRPADRIGPRIRHRRPTPLVQMPQRHQSRRHAVLRHRLVETRFGLRQGVAVIHPYRRRALRRQLRHLDPHARARRVGLVADPIAQGIPGLVLETQIAEILPHRGFVRNRHRHLVVRQRFRIGIGDGHLPIVQPRGQGTPLGHAGPGHQQTRPNQSHRPGLSAQQVGHRIPCVHASRSRFIHRADSLPR